MEYLRLTYEEVFEMVKELSMKIKKEFNPDYLVGLSRGGLVPLRMFSDFLGINDLGVISVKYYKGVDERTERPEVKWSPLEEEKTRVLLVDDIADTGRSIKAVLPRLENLFEEVRVATILKKPWSEVDPHYYSLETEAWVVFPWEVVETAKQIISKGREIGWSKEEIERELRKAGISEEEYSGLVEY